MKQNFAWHLAVAVILAAVMGMMSGCATVGKDFRTDAVKELKIGQTTKADVAKIFGKPWRTGIEDGEEKWTYAYYYYPLIGSSVNRDLVIRFDAAGRVTTYSFNTNETPAPRP